MRHESYGNRLLALKIFRIFVIAYVLIAFPALLFISQEFGFLLALALALILAFPMFSAALIRWRWPIFRLRELLYLTLLTIVAAGGCSALVWRWYYIGLDRTHLHEMEFARAKREIQEAPAFHGVQLVSTPKGQYFAHGSVKSQERLDELINRLAAQHIRWTVNDDLPGGKPGLQPRVGHGSMRPGE